MSGPTPAVIAQCPTCNGVKGIETELDNQATIDRWFDRGDILSRRTVGWFKSADLCRCLARQQESA